MISYEGQPLRCERQLGLEGSRSATEYDPPRVWPLIAVLVDPRLSPLGPNHEDAVPDRVTLTAKFEYPVGQVTATSDRL